MRKEIIGDCTLYLGDCRDIQPEYDSVLSDPPYGMSFQSNHRMEKHLEIQNDKTTDLLLWSCALPFKHSKYLFCRWDNLFEVPKPKSLLTWVKNNWSMGDLDHEHGRQTEVALFYNGEDHFWPNKRPTDVVYSVRTGNEFHPTEKPIDLMMQFVNFTSGVIYDPFMGSGSTLVAASKLSRKSIGCEIEPKYFDIACRRIEEAYRQPDLFLEPTKKIIQESFLD